MPRKRSLALTLVLAGVASSCGGPAPSPLASRDVYDSPTECKSDWGDDDASCETVLEEADANTVGAVRSSNGAYYIPRYYGPSYRYGSRPATIRTPRGDSVAVGNRAKSTRSVGSSGSSSGSRGSASRGGFGSSGRSSGASS